MTTEESKSLTFESISPDHRAKQTKKFIQVESLKIHGSGLKESTLSNLGFECNK